MNLIDVLLLVIILLSIYSGYHKGFILGTLDLLLLAAALIFAFWSSRYIADFIVANNSSIGVWTLPLAFISAYIFARIVLGAFAKRGLQAISPRTTESTVNKAFGIFPGLINGLITAAIVCALLPAIPMPENLSAKSRDSSIGKALTPHIKWAEGKLAPVFNEALNHPMTNISVRPESKKKIDLAFTVENPETREDLEASMLEMVNGERQKEGLAPLKADAEMQKVARAHSRDMFTRGYFSHINPEGETPAERAREAGVKFLTAGENLALAQTLKLAHAGLMNSPGHRANILHPSFGRVGIGILDGGRHGLMVTQNFRN